MDEVVGHMTEKVIIPPADQIEIVPRRYTHLSPEDYLPFHAGPDGVPEMVRAGDGYRIHITGITHNERGFPEVSVEAQEKLVRRLVDKIRLHACAIARVEETATEDAEIIVLAYGITSRVALRAVQMARERGISAGLLRPVVVWPFPENRVRELGAHARGFLVVEMNYGQMVREVERIVAGLAPVSLLGHGGGSVHTPEQILESIVALQPVAQATP